MVVLYFYEFNMLIRASPSINSMKQPYCHCTDMSHLKIGLIN